METKTPLPEIEKHDLTIGAFRQRKRLGMDITRMAIKLLFGHGSEDGLDDCRIDVIHDLLEKTGNVFTEMADQGKPIMVSMMRLIVCFDFLSFLF
jgi:hypothetical protein